MEVGWRISRLDTQFFETRRNRVIDPFATFGFLDSLLDFQSATIGSVMQVHTAYPSSGSTNGGGGNDRYGGVLGHQRDNAHVAKGHQATDKERGALVIGRHALVLESAKQS